MGEQTAKPDLESVDTMDARAVAAAYDDIQDAGIDWSVSVESDDLDADEEDALKDLLLNTVGHFRGIVGKDQFIPRGVYWSLVSDYAEELAEVYDEEPDWAEGMADWEIFREVVMPTEMARYFDKDPVACFWTLMYSKHSATGWLQHMNQDFYGVPEDFHEWVEDKEGWRNVLSTMAMVACMQDVAQKLRQDGYDVDLDHLEFRDDL